MSTFPQGCAGIADGNQKRYLAEPGGPSSFVTLEDNGSPSSGSSRARITPRPAWSMQVPKFFSNRGGDGRWCRACRHFLANRWNDAA